MPRNSVGAAQIKRNAVGPSKVAPNAVRTGHVLDGSLLTADFKAGQIPQGPKGDKGDKGEKGEKGDQGLPGISARQVVTASSASNSDGFKQFSVNCPAGKVSIGGGAGTSGAVGGVALRVTEPSGTGWYASAQEIVANNGNWSLRATVVCAKVSP